MYYYRRTPRALSSREFLGVTLVPFYSGKPRQATSIMYSEGYFWAIVGKSSAKKMIKVATSSDDAFRPRFERDDYLQRNIAFALFKLGVITEKILGDFNFSIKQKLTDKARAEKLQTYADMEDAMDTMGIVLTKEQQDQCNAMLKIEAV